MAENQIESAMNTEEEQIKETADLTVKLLDKRYPSPDKILRGVHPKSHGCVKATFRINQDIDKYLQVGLFAEPGEEYDAIIRFSNASARVTPDLDGGENGSRGMAIKVLDVGNNKKFILDDKGAGNQDFLMINTPGFVFANVEDYLRLTQVILKDDDKADGFFAPLAPDNPFKFPPEVVARAFKSFGIVREIKSKPVANPLGVQYFGAAPFLFGKDRVMRFSVMPSGGEQAQLIPTDISDDYLKNALIARMRQGEDVCFDFMIQVRGKDEEGLNLDDATSHWDESKTPYVTVARITIPVPQTGIDSKGHKNKCENLVYTPWHSLIEHEPLGGINRLRKNVYVASATHRGTTSKSPKSGKPSKRGKWGKKGKTSRRR